jgi:tripartite ATP-independent transporter DctM subunit
MSTEVIALLGVILVLVLIGFRMWIGMAMGVVGFLGIWLIRGLEQAYSVTGSVPFQNINNFTMTVLPMFTLMGIIIAETEIGSDLFRAAHKWVGHYKGGLASATILASGMMGAITGSHTTGTIVMTKIALPEMREYKYDDTLSTGAIAAGAPLSIIIPPSLAFVLYGLLTEQSIGQLFIAGIVPGIILMIAFMLVIAILCRINPAIAPDVKGVNLKEKILALKQIWAMLALFILVLGGIYGGFFTPTESGAVGALGALIIAKIKGQMSFKIFGRCIQQTALLTGMILVLLAGTYIFITFLSLSKLPSAIIAIVTTLNVPIFVVIMAIALMYVILGLFLPEFPMIVLTVPIIFPAIMALGIDPIWFGLFIVLLMAVGAVSPPIGLVVFLLSGVSGIPVSKIFRGVIPFIIADIIVIILVVIFPSLVTYLPSLM